MRHRKMAMKQAHYTQIKPFRIYALLLRAEENYAYIGKTTARRMSGVYSRHRTGAVKATECYFDQEISPELYLLEICNVTSSDAYKRVVAWCHLFLEEGYAGINHERTLSQARNLLPETKEIAEILGREPLEEILRRTYMERPSDGDLKPEIFTVTEASQKTIQMNIRIETQDKNRFDRFCRESGMNQREGFSILLDRITDSADYPAVAALLKKEEEKIERLKQENSRYKSRLEEWVGSGKSQKETELEKKLEFFRTGIQEYLQRLFPQNKGKSELPEISWRIYMRNLSENKKPQYPEQEGFMLLQLETILWGNTLHRPCFLVGKGEDGRQYLFRCYPRRGVVGFFIRESSYAKPGTFWYVGCQRSKDGAMELFLAIPLPQEWKGIAPQKWRLPEILEQERGKASLDSMIQKAQIKQQ